ncbi:MAG: hypothetical protein ABJC74_10300 [Gemmatimonadota bacterium]
MNLNRCISLAAVALGVALPLAAQTGNRSGRYDLKLSEADGRLLVGEELAKGNNGIVRLALTTEGNAFQIQNGRITLSATAATDMLSCPVWISGVPVIVGNQLTIAGADVRTDGVLCNGTLTVLKPKAIEALTAHPWDLAGRLAQASTRPALPGPRIPVSGCLAASQMTLRNVHASGNTLVVGVEVAARRSESGCP